MEDARLGVWACKEEFLYHGIDNKKYVSCVYIDYSKLFDTIDHTILCKKLARYGFRNDLIK